LIKERDNYLSEHMTKITRSIAVYLIPQLSKHMSKTVFYKQ